MNKHATLWLHLLSSVLFVLWSTWNSIYYPVSLPFWVAVCMTLNPRSWRIPSFHRSWVRFQRFGWRLVYVDCTTNPSTTPDSAALVIVCGVQECVIAPYSPPKCGQISPQTSTSSSDEPGHPNSNTYVNCIDPQSGSTSNDERSYKQARGFSGVRGSGLTRQYLRHQVGKEERCVWGWPNGTHRKRHANSDPLSQSRRLFVVKRNKLQNHCGSLHERREPATMTMKPGVAHNCIRSH